MSEFELYVFTLCIVVFVVLVSLFSVMTAIIVSQSTKLIRLGAEDARLLSERISKDKNWNSDFSIGVKRCLSIIMLILLLACFLLTVSSSSCERGHTSPTLPSIRVVKSESMAKREEKNKYLFDNELLDQIQMFDLIVTHPMPASEELKLYDIVVYEIDGEYIIHRIVGIEEPNSKHPNERYFLLQGDAVRFADKFPVKYSQMVGIYRGERVGGIGSFITFMQSPAGYLCFFLMLFALLILPLIERKLLKEERRRLKKIYSIIGNY